MTGTDENKPTPEILADRPLDLLWGAEAIAKALKLRTRKQAFEMLERGLIPAQKVGKRWVTSRSKLEEHFGIIGA